MFCILHASTVAQHIMHLITTMYFILQHVPQISKKQVTHHYGQILSKLRKCTVNAFAKHYICIFAGLLSTHLLQSLKHNTCKVLTLKVFTDQLMM